MVKITTTGLIDGVPKEVYSIAEHPLFLSEYRKRYSLNNLPEKPTEFFNSDRILLVNLCSVCSSLSDQGYEPFVRTVPLS